MSILFSKPDQKYGELSNFFPCPVVLDGLTYPTSEHAYQAQKFVNGNEASRELAERIRKASTPYKAKLLTRSSVPTKWAWQKELAATVEELRERGADVRSDWEDVKVDVMRKVLEAKFEQNSECRQVLVATGDAELVEHTATDAFWGDGYGGGQNQLGKLLQEIRGGLQN